MMVALVPFERLSHIPSPFPSLLGSFTFLEPFGVFSLFPGVQRGSERRVQTAPLYRSRPSTDLQSRGPGI